MFIAHVVTEDKVELSNLGVSDFLVHRVGVVSVGLSAEAGLVELLGHFAGVPVERDSNRHNHGLKITIICIFMCIDVFV